MTHMTDDIPQKLAQYISTQILKQPNRQIAADEALISSGLVDSFSLVDLALFVEDSYGVHLDDTELNADSFDSLAQLAALIRSRI
jgi:acyl carrier protein